MTSTFDLLTLKVVSQSRVTWATPVPILVFLSLSVLDLGPMYATDREMSDSRRQTDRRQTKASLNDPAYKWRGHKNGRRYLRLGKGGLVHAPCDGVPGPASDDADEERVHFADAETSRVFAHVVFVASQDRLPQSTVAESHAVRHRLSSTDTIYTTHSN